MDRAPVVDPDLCISCGLCISYCPGVFRFDENNKSECWNHKGATESEIQTAIDVCPVQAISWKQSSS